MVSPISTLPSLYVRACALTVALMSCFVCLASPQSDVQQPLDVRPLQAGVPVERELSGGQTHLYQCTLAAGQSLKVVIEQRGVDILPALIGPDSKQLIEDDNELDDRGIELLLWRAQTPGAYQLRLSARGRDITGRYVLRAEFFSGDERRALATQTYVEGLQLAKQPKKELYPQAIARFEQALAQWREAGDRLLEARILYSLAVLQRLLDNPARAAEYYEQVLPVYHSLGLRTEEAGVLNNLAAAYMTQGQIAKALTYYERAGSLSDALSRRGAAILLSNTASNYSNLGEYQKALEYYLKALSAFRELKAEADEMIVLGNMAILLRSKGEPLKGLEYNNLALNLSRKLKRPTAESLIIYELGLVWMSAGEPQRALELFSEALAIARQAQDRPGQVFALQGIGVVHQTQGDETAALDFFNQALELNRAIGRKQGEAAMLTRIGAILSGRGEFQRALDYQQQALAFYSTTGNRWFEIDTLLNLARTYRGMGDTQKTRELLDQALALSRETEGRPREAQVLYDLAALARSTGDLKRARELMEASLGNVEALRGKFGVQELKASFGASFQKYYEDHIALLMQMHSQDPGSGSDALALQTNERARARTLLDLLAEARAGLRQGVDATMLAQEQNLWQRLREKDTAWRQLLGNRRMSAQAAALAQEIAELKTQLQLIEAQIRQSSPRYAALTQPQPIRLVEMQQSLLDRDTVLLEFMLGEKQSWLWAVSSSSLDSFELPPGPAIEAAARRIYEQLTALQPKKDLSAAEQQKLVAEADARFQTEAAALSQMLLGQLAARLRQEWQGKRLVIVAAGALEYLPFAALPLPESKGVGDKGTRGQGDKGESAIPLLAAHEIVNLPSASALAAVRRETIGRKPAARVLAVFADPVFEASDPRLLKLARKRPPTGDLAANVRSAGEAKTSSSLNTDLDHALRSFNPSIERSSFSRLPFSREEAEEIAAHVPKGSVLKAMDFEASQATAMSGELSRYRIVHFATHGLLNSQHPELSGLVLSLVDENGKAQDGFLRMHEIFNLQLPADLVVLSACQTALGKEIKGEGLIGLTRGFMYAGSQRVVASLWQVDDLATAALMKRFYHGMLKDGMRPAAALRAAQLEMMRQKRWSSPFFWSAFIMQGEWR
jgi:tetratricopeptide (TPR) repeat protein